MTATIIRWPKHIRAKCGCNGENPACPGCNLFLCFTCRLAEGELTTDCPGEMVGPYMAERCLGGDLDYTRADGWVWKMGAKRGG